MILVTGSNGFLGCAVVDRLLTRGARGLRLLVREGSDRARLDAVLARHPGGAAEVVIGTLDSQAGAAALLHGVDQILHLAASMRGKPADMFTATVVSSRHLLDAIVAREEKPRVLLVSSFGVYGVGDLPPDEVVDEATPLEQHPALRDPYSHAKLEQEKLFASYHRRHGVPLAVLRPGVIYGPGGAALSPRVGLRLAGVFLFLGGENPLPLTYVDNCAEAICVAAERARFDGDAYNVVDDELVTCAEYLGRYRREVERLRYVGLPYSVTVALSGAVALSSRLSRGKVPALLSPYRARATWKRHRFSNEKLRGLGFAPIVSTEEGLSRTFASLRATGAGA